MEENECLSRSKTIQTLVKYDTEYSADSVEWCPHAPNQHFFVCGNYQLTENQENDSTKRFGRILLFSISPAATLKLVQKIETAAVLDQKWCPNQIDNVSILGVVNAKGTIEIYKFKNYSLTFLTSYKFIDDATETLILSLDWSTGKYLSNEHCIVCSDSKGNIHLLKLLDTELVLEKSWHGHEFQAWIAGFYYWDTNIIFSGGDDSVFLKYDIRVGDSPVAKNRRHEAGVTSFHSNKSKEYIVVSGSYDEHVRLWDIRNIKNPTDILKMPGPLWRLKWDPFSQKILIAACMLGGVHFVDASKSFKIVESYYEHKNISYGSDWSFLSSEDVKNYNCEGNVIIGSCSFYDHLLCVSKLTCDFKS